MSSVVLFEKIEIEGTGGVGVIRLNRPKALNAINAEVLDGLDAILAEQVGAGLGALIVTGAGERAFAAGADIAAMQDFSPLQAEHFARKGQAIFSRLESFPAPVIAAVNGFALGGGCELAMSCDLVLLAPSAVLGQPEVKLGVIPGFGGTQRLERRLGRQRALELMMTGRSLKAPEAVSLGLALEIVEGDVVQAALELARRILRNGPVAVRLVKRAVLETEHLDLSSGLAAEASLFALCFATEDQQEGMSAFMEKRHAAFTGR